MDESSRPRTMETVDSNTRRVAVLGVLASLAATAYSQPSTGPRSASSPRARASAKPCLVAWYSGFSGEHTTAHFDEALTAAVQALGSLRAHASGAEAEKLTRHILAIRDLQGGLGR